MKSIEELPTPEDYIQNPHFCPYCGADEIDATRFEAEGRVAWQAVRCDTCEAEWNDIFELVAIEKVVFDSDGNFTGQPLDNPPEIP